MKYKKLIYISGILLMVVLTVISCRKIRNSTESTNTDELIEIETLELAIFSNAYGEDVWREVATAFEKHFPTVKVDLTVDSKIEDVIGPKMKVGDYPDVVHLPTGREAALTEHLTKEKKIYPLTEMLEMTIPGEEILVKDKILPGFLDTYATNPYGDDVTYYAPMFYSPCGLFYNADLFEEKGWSVPKNWDEMWELANLAKEEGISLFTYPTAGYLNSFILSMIESSGGMDTLNKCLSYKDGIWTSDATTEVFYLIDQLMAYLEPSTVRHANNEDYLLNQQLILDNKALFCPGGTWVPSEMKSFDRVDGFKWGFTAVPSVKINEPMVSFCRFEQMWIPAEAENKEIAEQFIAFMYSDEAANIFAKYSAIQPIATQNLKMDEDEKLFYGIYENGAVAAMGGFGSTEKLDGLSLNEVLYDSVNQLAGNQITVLEWQRKVEETSDLIRKTMEE